MRKKKKAWRVYLLLLGFLVLFGFVAADYELKTVFYEVHTQKPKEKSSQQNSIRIALLTDLHSCKYGENEKELLDAIDVQKPDIILLGGDIFDEKIPHDNSLIVVGYVAEKYPTFYVTGNHEFSTGNARKIKRMVTERKAIVLDGQCCVAEIRSEKINICGIDDPIGVGREKMVAQLESVVNGADKNLFTVLLAHRPELINLYLRYDVDLILSGHSHGGQWRIPGLINGIYAPSEGIFPKYAGGEYSFDRKTMIVSRGLAKETTIVPRLFNPPELVIVDLK